MIRSLNKETLDIICAVQDYKKFIISNNILFNKEDGYEKVKEYYYSIPNDIFDKSVLRKNKLDLKKCMLFELSDDILDCDYDHLSKFKF